MGTCLSRYKSKKDMLDKEDKIPYSVPVKYHYEKEVGKWIQIN